jgi:hypothetical protein
VKNVRNTLCTRAFTSFCTSGPKHFSGIKQDRRKPQEKTRREKNTKSGGSDPNFSAAQRRVRKHLRKDKCHATD